MNVTEVFFFTKGKNVAPKIDYPTKEHFGLIFIVMTGRSEGIVGV